MSRLRAATRNALPATKFGLPEERKYPMNDREHAANAKGRARQQVKKGNLSPAKEKRIDTMANRILGKNG
jgi:hypothetical protein